MAASLRLTDHESVLAFLFRRINYERTPASPRRSRALNLDRMRGLLERLGNPHVRTPFVHIAGTKGKGSTATMISSILAAAGYRTGLYTSPHLEQLEERIVVDGQAVSGAELVDLANSVWPAVAALDDHAGGSDARLSPTFFEITTAMALLHFARRGVDVAVLEVGLGGRLDSTNVCQPLVSVITSISFDHMRQLGNTLAAIASEKAGIIKPQVPVVSGVVSEEPAGVIERIAQERHSRLFRLGREFDYTYHPPACSQTGLVQAASCDYRETIDGVTRAHGNLQIGLLGPHQAANASVAVAVVERLRAAGWRCPEQALRTGLAQARCPARVEVLAQRPAIIIDTAHNVASIEALLQTLNESFPRGPRVLIFAASRDKDAAGMLARLLPQFDDVLLTQFVNNPRAVLPQDLATLSANILTQRTVNDPRHARVTTCATPSAAWSAAWQRLTPEHLVCITGSFFLAAEMRTHACQTLGR
jgi:dihydrofolate synthase/folylpolyglutamate synthase